MEVRIDGNRSTSESWLEAHRIPLQELPAITDDEQRVAEKLAISSEEYRRSKYAADLTKQQLQLRAFKVGQFVESWLRNHQLLAEVKSVWLKTFDGKFRIDVEINTMQQSVFIAEDLMNDILDSGSSEAQRSLDRLLAANFGILEGARAS